MPFTIRWVEVSRMIHAERRARVGDARRPKTSPDHHQSACARTRLSSQASSQPGRQPHKQSERERRKDGESKTEHDRAEAELLRTSSQPETSESCTSLQMWQRASAELGPSLPSGDIHHSHVFHESLRCAFSWAESYFAFHASSLHVRCSWSAVQVTMQQQRASAVSWASPRLRFWPSPRLQPAGSNRWWQVLSK